MEISLVYNVVLISAVQQSGSVIQTQTSAFKVLFHYDLSHGTEWSPLCYTVGPCCISSLYIIGVCVCVCACVRAQLSQTHSLQLHGL